MTQAASEPDELVRRLKLGDEQALARLFSDHRDRLWRIIFFRLHPKLQSRVDPDDVLQETYLNAAQRLGHFQGDSPTSFFVWLRMIATQTLIDTHRKHLETKARDAGRDVSIHGAGYPHATSTSLALHLVGNRTSPSQAAIRHEMYEQLERALEGMDPIDREVLALRHFEELTNSEVAAVLGIQQKAASIRYVRALGRLKRVLAQLSDFRAAESLEESHGDEARDAPQGGGGNGD